ncbi:MAG: MMPL family transporter [Planctomycetaceae bacterium]
MVSDFYRRHSARLLLSCLIALPILTVVGEMVPANNDIETWLPRRSQVRQAYDDFCRTFGADETILIAFQKPFPSPERIEAAARRLSGLDGVATCWSRDQVVQAMLANDVSEEHARARIVNLLATPHGELETMLLSINEHGIAHRRQTLLDIKQQLAYCSMDHAVLAGGPIVAAQLDKLGSRQEAMVLFGLTLIICLVLLYVNIGCWKTAGGLMLANILCIELTLATIWLVGGEMNFIMSSLPVMVMVFSTASAIHYIGHYSHEYPRSDAVARALRSVLRPSIFATITTIIGLISLAVSDVGPIPAFGAAAAIGTGYSFLTGVLLTPAVLIALRYVPRKEDVSRLRLQSVAMYVVNHPWRVMVPGVVATIICTAGVFQLRSLISALDFLPDNDPVLCDTLLIQEKLTSPTSIEGVVDFGSADSSFVERLRDVRGIEATIADVDNVCHALSLADFFPEELSENTLSLSKLASAAGTDNGISGLMADGCRLWRVSIRLRKDDPADVRRTMDLLQDRCAGLPISFTGLGPLLEHAQTQIFEGFWKSFASAFVLITIVMIIALRSLTAGLVAMVPNLTPIILVFGTLGWCDYPIDIGIMMTASIALGLAVDGTFHFLFSYRDCRVATGCRYRAVRRALLQTGLPIMSSALICGCGLLALGLSPFKPTMRFGVLMFTLLLAALVGDLLLLPAFLACGAKRKRLKANKSDAVVKPYRIAA